MEIKAVNGDKSSNQTKRSIKSNSHHIYIAHERNETKQNTYATQRTHTQRRKKDDEKNTHLEWK